MEDTIKVEDLNSIEKKVSIHITPETVNKKLTEFSKNIQKEAQVPGFRKGKVPLKLLNKYFQNKAKDTVSQMLLSEFYQSAVRDYNIIPIGNPRINATNNGRIGQFNDDNSYDVELTVETLPKIDPVGYDDIEIEVPEYDIDELCEKRMSKYQEDFAERRQVNEAQKDDTLVIDFVGFMDGKEFDGGRATDYSIDKLCEGKTNLSDFEEQLVGAKLNETRRVKIVFPKEYPENLAEKEAEFDVIINSIVRKTKAEVDEDLALMTGFESVEELKESVKNEVNDEINNRNRQIAEVKISDALIEKNNFDIPRSLLEEEKNRLIKQNNLKNISEQMAERIESMAISNIKRAILFDAIYEKENIDITPSELDEYLEEQAKIYNKTKDEIVSMLNNTGQMDSFIGVLRARKTVDFIINKNTRKESEND